MTLTVRCKDCDYILYDGSLVHQTGHHGTAIQRVFEKNHGRCPNCGRSLELENKRVEVSAASEP